MNVDTSQKQTGRPKLCVVLPAHWDAVMGGSQYQAKMLVEHLVSRNQHDIYYLARRISQASQPKGYSIRLISTPTGIRRYSEVMDTFDLFHLLKEINPDIIYQRVGCAYTGITAYYARKYHKRCVWHVAHDREVMPQLFHLSKTMPLRIIEKLMMNYGIRNSSAIITQTQQQNDLMKKYYGRSADAVVPNYHPLPDLKIIKGDQITITWVANLKPWKRPEIFIKLAREFSGIKGIKFIMIGKPIGDPEWCESIRCEAEKLPNLEYMGGQPQEIVNEVLSASHIFVNTSVQEGFANTFIQSWLRYVPVLSMSVNPDHIFDTKNIGKCTGTYENLKNTLFELIRDKVQIENMGNDARRYAEETYANNRSMEIIVDILAQK